MQLLATRKTIREIYRQTIKEIIHYKVREDGRILSRAAYVVLGVTVEGYKDILSITAGANETLSLIHIFQRGCFCVFTNHI